MAFLGSTTDAAVRTRYAHRNERTRRFKEQRTFDLPPAWPDTSRKLARIADADVHEKSTLLAVLFGDPAGGLAELRKTVAGGTDAASRGRALQALVQHRDPELPAMLRKLLDDPQMASPALRAMAAVPDDQTPH